MQRLTDLRLLVSAPQIERDWAAKGMPLASELARAAERSSGACDVGTGERYVATTPTEPLFEVVHDDVPPERMPVPVSAADDAAVSEARERSMVREFVERLARATGEQGGGLWQRSRVRDAPRRPAAGWGLLVKPLGVRKEDAAAATQAAAQGGAPHAGVAPHAPFVALPDGTRRALTPDERAMVQQQRVKPRRKLGA